MRQMNSGFVVTDAIVDEYWERGYWISPKLLNDDQIEQLREDHQRLWSRDYDRYIPSQYGIAPFDPDSNSVRQQCNAFWLMDNIRETVLNPLIGEIASRLMKVDTVRLWHDQAIYKPPQGDGQSLAGNIGWHQDYGHWQISNTTNMCTAWIALQDTNLNNGGMRTIVGSHKWGLVEDSDTFGEKDLESLAVKFAEQGGDNWIDEPCILKAGQASFHHALTFHGSGPNLSDEPRLSIVAHMMPDNTAYQPKGTRWHPNLAFLGPNARGGETFNHNEFFPVIYSKP